MQVVAEIEVREAAMRQSPLCEFSPAPLAVRGLYMPATAPPTDSTDRPEQTLTAPSLTRRMACWMYEGTLLFGVLFGTGLFFFGLLFAVGHLAPSLVPVRDAFNNRYALQAYVFLLLALYFTWFWTKGQTLAMKTWLIRVVDRQGRALTRPKALLRYMWSWIWFLPPLAVGGYFQLPGGELAVILVGWIAVWALLARFHPQRQFLHDALAGTRLVHHKPAEPAKGRKFWHL
jgi:uncharacterized RDD family membrane protein YckC